MEVFDTTVAAEGLSLGQALLAGAVMGVYYDLFRILRRVFRFGYATIIAQDCFFWLTSAVGMFFAAIWVSGGTVRIYFVLVALLGWGFYAATVGALLMRIVSGLIAVLRRIYNSTVRRAAARVAVWARGGMEKLRERSKKRKSEEKTARNDKKQKKAACKLSRSKV